jgi:hypothetical protein
MPDRPTKITFADMRDMGVRGLLILSLGLIFGGLVIP